MKSAGSADHASGPRQLLLDLTRDPSYDPDEFLVSACNASAFEALRTWPDWPDRVLVLVGPARSGKSHLAAIWAQASGARYVAANAPLRDEADAGAAIVLEDCDRAHGPEADLFHRVNIARQTGGWLLITARRPPDRWELRTPDLLSRLRLAPLVTIGAPDPVLIRAVLVKLFADRQIAIDADVVAYAARHCEQSLGAANRFVEAVDEASLEFGRRITRPLAAATLNRLNATAAGLPD
jgi:chromosomal replication initiation ATPase DnaA